MNKIAYNRISKARMNCLFVSFMSYMCRETLKNESVLFYSFLLNRESVLKESNSQRNLIFTFIHLFTCRCSTDKPLNCQKINRILYSAMFT